MAAGNAFDMRLAILAFAAGSLALQFRAELPGVAMLAGLLLAGVVLLLAGLGRWPLLLVPAGAVLGFAWAGGLAQHRLADALPEVGEGRDVAIVGVVAGLPQRFEHGVRFDFDVERAGAAMPSRLSLAWYRGWRVQEDDDFHVLPALAAGERWHLTVRAKRPHGNLNPHGFDFEAWLFERNIRATGYVRKAETNRRIDGLVVAPGYWSSACGRICAIAICARCPTRPTPAFWWPWRWATSRPSIPNCGRYFPVPASRI